MTVRNSQDCSPAAEAFVITGCQRSGTSMLGHALEAHPRIELFEENDERFHSNGPVTRELDLAAAAAYVETSNAVVGFKAPRESHRIGEVDDAIGNVRVVWIERDIRQAVSSMLRLRWPHGSWATLHAPKEIAKHIAVSDDSVAQSLFEEIERIEDEDVRGLALAALCWSVKRDQREQAKAKLGPRMMRVSYDDLVSDSPAALRRIIDFLGCEWSANVLDHPAWIDGKGRPDHTVHDRPIDTDSLGSWRRHLSSDDLAVIADISDRFALATGGMAA